MAENKLNKIALIFLIVIISMFIVALIMAYDYYSKSSVQYIFNDPSMKMTLGIIFVVGSIVVYDLFIKKKRRGNGKGKIRHGWNEIEKEEVRNRQGGVCNKCEKHPPRWEYHHKNGNRSDNSLSNCEGLCPNCHSVKTHE